MSEQLAIDFDARKHARRRDPSTSKAAALDAERWVLTQAGRVYAALKALGPAGKTRIAARAGLSDVQVARRLADLEDARLAAPLEQTEPSSNGKPERIWVAL